MGVRTTAARLGLGLAAASARMKIVGSSSNLRRSSNLAATVADVEKKKGFKFGSGSGSESEMDLVLDKEKSIYLCFMESSRCGDAEYVNHVVRPIRLSSLDADDDEEEYLSEAAYKRSTVNKKWDFSIRFGSQILFAFGRTTRRHICWIDPSTRPIKFQVSSPTKTKIKSLPIGKHDMMLGEVDRKLYCIHNNSFWNPPYSDAFEVLDPENDSKWRPLDAPPFIKGRHTCEYNVAFLEGSKKILGWELEKPGVFCFDATKPENGWIESPPSLGDTIPFVAINRPFIIQNHHPDIGNFHLMFKLEFGTDDEYSDDTDEPLSVSTFFMSNNCDSFQPINKPLQLSELCREYVNYEFTDYPPSVYSDFEFVQLGTQKVCLVLHKYFHGSRLSRPRNTGILYLVTFEYDIITSNNTTVEDSKPPLEIQTRFLEKRRFRYCSRQLRKPDYTHTHRVSMTGAFLL